MEIDVGRAVIVCVVVLCILIGCVGCYAYSAWRRALKKRYARQIMYENRTATVIMQNGGTSRSTSISNDSVIFHLQNPTVLNNNMNRHKDVLSPSYNKVIHDTTEPPPSYTSLVYGDSLY